MVDTGKRPAQGADVIPITRQVRRADRFRRLKAARPKTRLAADILRMQENFGRALTALVLGGQAGAGFGQDHALVAVRQGAPEAEAIVLAMDGAGIAVGDWVLGVVAVDGAPANLGAMVEAARKAADGAADPVPCVVWPPATERAVFGHVELAPLLAAHARGELTREPARKPRRRR
jgi:hypothetical protein